MSGEAIFKSEIEKKIIKNSGKQIESNSNIVFLHLMK